MSMMVTILENKPKNNHGNTHPMFLENVIAKKGRGMLGKSSIAFESKIFNALHYMDGSIAIKLLYYLVWDPVKDNNKFT